ncbi:hypothetical protein ACEWY4_021341 [Coilia grayii]|uniref:TSG101 and ALIX binding domain-containing protein n=1 Tax=Coilia grayii TaxID=363190 RepID=A0ABD1JC32_9TELE
MSLHARDADERAKVLHALKTETEEIKNRLVAVSARCHELENIKMSESQALEKNQQWLAYDQQREAYVTSVLTRIHQLEQQQGLTSAANHQQQTQLKAPDSDARNCQDAQQQYAEVLKNCEEQLNQEFESIAQAQTELEQLKRKVEDKQEELCRVQSLLQDKQNDLDRTQMHIHDKKEELDQVWHQIKERNGHLGEVQDLLHSKWAELEELQNQIQVKQCELHQVQREKTQIQQQLKDHKTELRKLDKVQSKTGNYEEETQPVQERQVRQSCQGNKASPGASSPLDESFLECPNCQIQYPASRHRELVIHIDQCCR